MNGFTSFWINKALKRYSDDEIKRVSFTSFWINKALKLPMPALQFSKCFTSFWINKALKREVKCSVDVLVLHLSELTKLSNNTSY